MFHAMQYSFRRDSKDARSKDHSAHSVRFSGAGVCTGEGSAKTPKREQVEAVNSFLKNSYEHVLGANVSYYDSVASGEFLVEEMR